jgi:hypothetical protein
MASLGLPANAPSDKSSLWMRERDGTESNRSWILDKGESTHTHTHMNTYIYTKYTCIHASIHTCIHASIHTYIHACMHTYAYLSALSSARAVTGVRVDLTAAL